VAIIEEEVVYRSDPEKQKEAREDVTYRETENEMLP
jgi:hypothetical protein